ncbi:MAG: transposase [Lachnospiraceae bacterium]|nr:transposase [Lachnospiraceae bacterium]
MSKQRIWYEGARYHVMARSIRSLQLFHYEEDYETFWMILANTMKRYPFVLNGYCMMTTHFHLLLGTQMVPIWTIMQKLQQNYAMYFNRKYGTRGHLFDSRYTSRVIENDPYFLEVSRYIHLNPVRASIVKFPVDYPYSSYDCYVAGRTDPILNTEEILGYFNGDKCAQYRLYVESAVTQKEMSISKDSKTV